MKEDTLDLTTSEFIDLGKAVYDIIKNYPITVEDLINAMQVYAEQQEMYMEYLLKILFG